MADAECASWQMIEALDALVGRVAVTNGYFTDLGAEPRVLDRTQQVDPARAFVIILAETFETVDDKSNHRTLCSGVDVVLEYVIPRAPGVSPEQLAHRGRADLVRALATDLRGGPKGFTSISITGSAITSPEEPGSDLVIAQVTARAVLSESLLPA